MGNVTPDSDNQDQLKVEQEEITGETVIACKKVGDYHMQFSRRVFICLYGDGLL
jgi:hypothetical protein